MVDERQIGLIGIGLLGTSLAGRLLHRGYVVRGFDIDPQRRQQFSDSGGSVCETATEVVQGCRICLLSLPTSDIATEVLQQLQSDLQSGQIILDTTTGDPAQMEAHSQTLQSQGVQYLETTVAGSSDQVRQGQAVLFVAGDPDTAQSVGQLLRSLSRQHFHLGTTGRASAFKLVHNLILGLNRAVLAEGLAFAEALGFESESVLEILQQTPAASAVMAGKGLKMVRRDYEPQARLVQHLKDVRLILSQAAACQASTPLSQRHADLLTQAIQLGFGQADNSAVIEAFRPPRIS